MDFASSPGDRVLSLLNKANDDPNEWPNSVAMLRANEETANRSACGRVKMPIGWPDKMALSVQFISAYGQRMNKQLSMPPRSVCERLDSYTYYIRA